MGMDRFAVEHSLNQRPSLGTRSAGHADSSSSSRRQVGTRATHFVIERRTESAVLASLLIALLLLVASSIAVLEFEVPDGGNIASAQDAMWWSISTMTTVGYGDRYRITAEGRIVAVFLMAAGAGLFATLSGAVASWFLSPVARQADTERAEIKELLLELRNRRPVP